MGSLGVPELIVIFVIALIFFGPKKLPELGRSLGRSINEFKKASNELRSTLDEEIRLDERRQSQPAVMTSTPAPPTIDVPAQVVHTPIQPTALPSVSETLAQPDTISRGQHGS